jgi:phage anti-repressor protein
MKRTVTQWTNIQYALRKMEDGDSFLESHIEYRTYGKRWSQEVGIGLHAKEVKMVEKAEQWLLDNPDKTS